MISFEHNHVPTSIHMPSITVPPFENTHLIAMQCGDEIRNGDMINPYKDDAAQYLTYI